MIHRLVNSLVESCQRLIIEISTGQWISPMRDREAEACARVSSRKAARIRSASSRYLPVERISPLPPPSPSPDMNCYEINRACIYNIYVCVYTLRNKLWNEFKIVDLLSEQMKDFVILVRCMDGGCVRKTVACLILENYICVYRFENEQTSDLITCQPRLGWIVEIVDSDE